MNATMHTLRLVVADITTTNAINAVRKALDAGGVEFPATTVRALAELDRRYADMVEQASWPDAGTLAADVAAAGNDPWASPDVLRSIVAAQCAETTAKALGKRYANDRRRILADHTDGLVAALAVVVGQCEAAFAEMRAEGLSLDTQPGNLSLGVWGAAKEARSILDEVFRGWRPIVRGGGLGRPLGGAVTPAGPVSATVADVVGLFDVSAADVGFEPPDGPVGPVVDRLVQNGVPLELAGPEEWQTRLTRWASDVAEATAATKSNWERTAAATAGLVPPFPGLSRRTAERAGLTTGDALGRPGRSGHRLVVQV